jgi:hypothetical protein
MYANGKMRTVETIPEMEGEIKENHGGVSSSVIYCKNFINDLMYPHPAQ